MKKSKLRSSKKQRTKRTKRKKIAPALPPTAAASVVAPTSGSCATCFYGRMNGTVRNCRINHPTLVQGPPAQIGLGWPVVADNDWCGEGMDATNYGSFSPGSTQVSQAAVPVWIAPNPNPGGTLTHIATAGSYLLRSGAGWITGISVNTTAVNAQLTCYDGTDTTGSVIAVLDVSKGNPSPQTAAPWGFTTGFFVVLTGGNADLTIVSHSI